MGAGEGRGSRGSGGGGAHLAGAEASFLDDVGVRDVDDPRLTHHAHEPVVGAEEARGAEAVAVELRAELLAVAEGEERRAVPRLRRRGKGGRRGSGAGERAEGGGGGCEDGGRRAGVRTSWRPS